MSKIWLLNGSLSSHFEDKTMPTQYVELRGSQKFRYLLALQIHPDFVKATKTLQPNLEAFKKFGQSCIHFIQMFTGKKERKNIY